MEWKKKNMNLNQFNKDTSDKYYRSYQDSPIFRIQQATLTAGSYTDYSLAEHIPASAKFLPLTNIHVANNSAVSILLFINGGTNAFLVPSGTQITFDRATLGGGVNFLRVQNGDSTTSTTGTDVDLMLWKEGIVVDQAFKNMHKAFFKFIQWGK